jgi:hypothetical protein
MAMSTSEFSRDERAWYSVVEEILKCTQSPLDIVPSQLKTFPAILLPMSEGAPLSTVKIDFSLCFSSQIEDAVDILTSIEGFHRQLNLSGFNDPDPRPQFTAALLVVKLTCGIVDEVMY